MLRIVLIVAAGVVLLAGVMLAYILSARQASNGPSKVVQAELKDDLSKSKLTATSSTQKIVSSLGFSVEYDPTALSARGQITDPASSGSKVFGETFDDNELNKTRPYSIVTFSQPGNNSFSQPELKINTNIRASFWDQFKNEPNAKTHRLALLTSYLTSTMTDKKTTATKPVPVTIRGISYLYTVLSRDNSAYGISQATETYLYTTVQNGRPYWVKIYNLATMPTLKSTFESVIATLSYNEPDASMLGEVPANARLASEVSLPDDTSNTLDTLDSNTILPVILSNQPAVVRILTVRCGTVTLSKDTHRVSMPNSCQGEVGSGSFISSDGYIATNGHVVTITDGSLLSASLQSVDATSRLLDFLVAIGNVTDAQRTALMIGLQQGDASASAALAQLPASIDASLISVIDSRYQYGIQTSNQPIRIHDYKVAYNDTILSAKLIDKNYDAAASDKALRGDGAFTASDVALLKADGTFPTVKLAQSEALQPGDSITAIGYPGFVDNNVSTDKWQTIPTITQGQVNSIEDDSSTGGRIGVTSVQIAQGNSGGPAFNAQGEQGGLMTYGAITCADAKCFGDGMFRDIGDILALVKTHNIQLDQGKVTQEWKAGLKAYGEGNYKQALHYFDAVKRDYPANYLVPELSRMARSKVGSETDTSSAASTTTWLLFAGMAILGIGVIVVVVSALLLVRNAARRRKATISSLA